MKNFNLPKFQKVVQGAVLGLLLVAGLTHLEAQVTETYDRIELKNGGVLNGTITALTVDSISFQRMNGESEWVFPLSQIQRYTIGHNADQEQAQSARLPIMSRFYADLSIATLNAARDQWGTEETGPFALNLNLGYQFSQWFGMGIRASRYEFPAYPAPRLYPLGLDFRGFLADHSLSPHYRLSAGYAFPGSHRRNFQGPTKPRGGFFVNPSLGLSWFVGNSLYISADIGAYIGKATFYNENLWWPWTGTEVEKRTLKRWQGQIGFGLLLFGENN